MAPPTIRRSAFRSGMNKKARFSAFTGYLVASFGMLIGVILLAVSIWQPHLFSNLRTQASDIVSPAANAGAVARDDSRSFLQVVAGYYRAGSKNAQLKREMEIARVKLAEAEAVKQENKRLKAILGLRDRDPEPVAMARLIGSTSASARRFAYLSRGRSDGVQPGMPVVAAKGLVGRVLESGDHSSRIMLLTDTESMVPVRRSTDNIVAFAEGRANGSLRIRLIDLGINPLKTGDVFVTSGAGGLFPPGVAVAVVSKITKDGAIANLLANPAATDFVAIEPQWHGNIKDLEAPSQQEDANTSGTSSEPNE
ncbi:rod shape-determining protein MreC [Altericroceibacterium spongiae]|uniref:Cell shape-determining protein MreC n=1 Tax=Altericroceibacterium spongiae TaxID=2320269 RepID=A0A420ERX8_9SPHN|nr:rod shape-determining protein MreC [Altericroceibacterium spongiae]RKF23421.1 rod shape-determining protein MreC [Altericroceibacterium spongiae]